MDINIKKAVALFGSQSALAKALGGKTRQGHVYQWLHKLKKVTPEVALKIEATTSGKVRAEKLNPDFFALLKRSGWERSKPDLGVKKED